MNEDITGYCYTDANLNPSHGYLIPALMNILVSLNLPPKSRRVFELGCGNGSVAELLAKSGWDVTGVDLSKQGIEQANRCYPNLKIYEGSAYDDLAAKYGQFPVVISLEVAEHVYSPRQYAATLYSLVAPGGGIAILSTPYHGYWKNVAMAVSGKMDAHFTALWDHGHIKFWSFKTLNALLKEVGFSDISFHRVGRFPALAKSMIAVAYKTV